MSIRSVPHHDVVVVGNIAQTYKRPDLAENILDPNKTIAQGFATNVFTLKDGTVNVGFVVCSAADAARILLS